MKEHAFLSVQISEYVDTFQALISILINNYKEYLHNCIRFIALKY